MIKLAYLLLFLCFFNISNAQKIVGIVTDHVPTPDVSPASKAYSKFPHFAIRKSYVESFQAACKDKGVVVILLPIQKDREIIKKYANMIDGLVLIGNSADINPKHYKEKILNNTVEIAEHDDRFEFESNLLKEVMSQKKPIFGTCAGEQLINVILGGSLYQDIPAQVKPVLNHSGNGNVFEHTIEVAENTMLEKILKDASVDPSMVFVNSVHHQAVKTLGKGLVASASAPDGIIEAIELTNYPFLIGTQWHPEFNLSDADRAIINAFCVAVSQ